MPPADLFELMKEMEKQSPGILKKLDVVAGESIQKSKLLLYNLLIKENPNWHYDKVDEILVSLQNYTLDINWNKDEYRYRLVLSKRKLEKEKEPTNGTGNSTKQ